MMTSSDLELITTTGSDYRSEDVRERLVSSMAILIVIVSLYSVETFMTSSIKLPLWDPALSKRQKSSLIPTLEATNLYRHMEVMQTYTRTMSVKTLYGDRFADRYHRE